MNEPGGEMKSRRRKKLDYRDGTREEEEENYQKGEVGF